MMNIKSISNKGNNNIFRILRMCYGLGIEDMAEKCGVSSVYYGQLERGTKENPSKKVIEQIASACGIRAKTIEYFLAQKEGAGLAYQQSLIHSLERLANQMQMEELKQQAVLLEEET